MPELLPRRAARPGERDLRRLPDGDALTRRPLPLKPPRIDYLRGWSSGKGHATIGFMACTPVAVELLHVHLLIGTLAVLSGGMFGGLLPDSDSPHSTLGKRGIRVPFVSHRGPTHSLLACAIATGLCALAPDQWRWLALGVALGYLLHLQVDFRRLALLKEHGHLLPRLTIWRGYVPWLWPYRPERRRLLRTSGHTAKGKVVRLPQYRDLP